MAVYCSRRPLTIKRGLFAMNEIWKDVVGYEGRYQVSNYGNVRNNKGLVLKPQTRQHGYLSVWLYGGEHLSGRTGKAFSIHRIVAEAFIPNPMGCEEVNHIDECKTNNRADNLEWCTHKENSNRGTRGARIGESNRTSSRRKRRAIAQYTLSGELVQIYPSVNALRRAGYNASNAWNCANKNPNYGHSQGYVWKFLDS